MQHIKTPASPQTEVSNLPRRKLFKGSIAAFAATTLAGVDKTVFAQVASSTPAAGAAVKPLPAYVAWKDQVR